jgi:arylamine N-acetyltransferase
MLLIIYEMVVENDEMSSSSMTPIDTGFLLSKIGLACSTGGIGIPYSWHKIFMLSLSPLFSILKVISCFPELDRPNHINMGDSGVTYLIASAAENSIKPAVIYTPSQISQYLNHISLPLEFSNSKPDLRLLAALQRHHLASIPFENLALHYSLPPHTISLDPQAVYDKFIARHRGGYCMEQNLFFAHMLRSLGFTVYSAGARVRKREHGIPVGDYMGWSHVVSIVTIGSDLSSSGESQQYMVDVGFGGDGPTKPITLTDGRVTRNLGTQEVKLKYEKIDSNVDPTQKLWVYKVRNHEMDIWKDCCKISTMYLLCQHLGL